MRYLPINNSLFIENRNRFVKMLSNKSAAVFYSNDQQPRNGDQYFPFRQQSDFFYLTGIIQEKSILLIAPDCKNKNYRIALFLLKTNEQIAIWEGKKYSKEEAKNISGIDNVFWLDDFDKVFKEVTTAIDDKMLKTETIVLVKNLEKSSRCIITLD